MRVIKVTENVNGAVYEITQQCTASVTLVPFFNAFKKTLKSIRYQPRVKI